MLPVANDHGILFTRSVNGCFAVHKRDSVDHHLITAFHTVIEQEVGEVRDGRHRNGGGASRFDDFGLEIGFLVDRSDVGQGQPIAVHIHLNRFDPQDAVSGDFQGDVRFLDENIPVRVRHGQCKAIGEISRRNDHPEDGGIIGICAQFYPVLTAIEGDRFPGSRGHLDVRILTEDRRHGRFSGQRLSVVAGERDGCDGHGIVTVSTIELECQIAAHVLEFQQIPLRDGHHRVGSGTEGFFPVGLFRRQCQCQNTGIADCRRFLVRIDGTDIIQVVSRSEVIIPDPMEGSGVLPGFAVEHELLVQGALVENGNQVRFVPENLDVLVEIDSRFRIGIGLQICVKDDVFGLFFGWSRGNDIKLADGTGNRKQAYERLQEKFFLHGSID